jgi:hypothetical protein
VTITVRRLFEPTYFDKRRPPQGPQDLKQLGLQGLSRAEVAAKSRRAVLAGSGDPEAVHFTQSVSERESEVLRKGLRKKASRG